MKEERKKTDQKQGPEMNEENNEGRNNETKKEGRETENKKGYTNVLDAVKTLSKARQSNQEMEHGK